MEHTKFTPISWCLLAEQLQALEEGQYSMLAAQRSPYLHEREMNFYKISMFA